MRNKKRILLVTDHFPPEASGAVARTYSIYKYLKNDFEIKVITLNNYGKLPNENIEHINRVEGSINWYKNLTIKKIFLKLIGKFYQKFMANRDFIWEKNIDYNMIRKFNPDIVYSTYPGLSSWILGCKIKDQCNSKFVVELRDGFSYEPIENKTFFNNFFKVKFEKKILKISDLIITIGNSLTIEANKITNFKKQIETIYNGFESSDFKGLDFTKSKKNQDEIKIIHFGSLLKSKNRDISNLLLALKELKLDKKIILEFVGNISQEEKNIFGSINNPFIEILFKGAMKKLNGFQYLINEADYLLLYGDPGQKTFISSKIFEYFNLRKPILAICKGNDVESLVINSKSGLISDFTVKGIKFMFTKIINEKVEFNPDYDYINSFTRKNQTDKIANLLKNLH